MAARRVITIGSPVRVVFKKPGTWGALPGKYKGVVSNAALSFLPPSIVNENGFLRIILTHTPIDARWMLGKPLYVKPEKLVALPSKAGLRVPHPSR